MSEQVQDGEVNLDLLLGTPREAKNPLDFYASGIYALQQAFPLQGSVAPKWLANLLNSIGSAYASAIGPEVKTGTEASLQALIDGGIANLPGWGCDWNRLQSIWSDRAAEVLLAPVSHCLRTMCDHRKDIPSPSIPKIILGIILGDIGAAIHLSSLSKSNKGFKRELKSGLGKAANIRDLLNLYYMFGLSASIMRAGHIVEVLGTASKTDGGPDFKFTCSGHGQQYCVEANRKEPNQSKLEQDIVKDSIDEKAAKVKPCDGKAHSKWEPCLLAVDITSLDLPRTKESLAMSLVSRGSCGEYIYRAYSDPKFNERLGSCKDSLSVASVRIATLRKEGYGVAGVLLTRNQYLQIDTTGIAQAEGAVLVLHKDFENLIPSCIARCVYLVDETCIPA